ncbi:MAG: beta-galactosidase [Firmicutes bacterium]|nr:beta-galactosidase [Bacillota bacterium]
MIPQASINKTLPYRTIHLDFHTSPEITPIAGDFDPADFVETLRSAHANSITCFARCHHGMCYYPSKVAPVHPGLSRDLLGEMIEACHSAGMRIPVYTTVVWDEYSAANHADWLQVDEEGKLVGRPPFGNGYSQWRYLCMNSPYVDYLAAHVEELVRAYDIDGLFFDITFQHTPGCVCNHCMASMRKLGLDPESEADRRKHTLIVERNLMKRMTDLVWDIKPGIDIFFNGRLRLTPQVQNGIRPEAGYFSHFEIESLPSGQWGYDHFPMYARYYKNLGKEILGHTGRFHKSWGDFGGLKNRAALEYECFRMLALGAKCCIGDQLHPGGRLDAAAYERIGQVYASVEKKEPWCRDSVPLAEVGVLISESTRSNEGALRVLQECHYQFDFIDEESDLGKYRVIVAPDRVSFSEGLAGKLRDYLSRGGAMLLSYKSGLDEERSAFVLPEMGVSYLGDAPYSPDFIRVDKAKAPIARGIEDMDHVMYERGLEVRPGAGTETLARVAHPYFNRTYEHFCSHMYSPVAKLTDIPAATRSGNVIYIASPIFAAYRKHGNLVYKRIVENCLRLLLPSKMVESNLPSTAEVMLHRQGDRAVLHILNYIPQRRAESIDLLEDVIPLHDVKLEVRLWFEPRRVYTAPALTDLEFEAAGNSGNSISVTVPVVEGHQMVIFE